MWRAAKEIVGWNRTGPPTQLYIEGQHISSPKAIAALMNKFYIDKQKKIVASIPRSGTDPLDKLRAKMEGKEGVFKFREVTEKEVLQLINSIKNSTSSGVDWIDNKCLKLVASVISPAITRIINLSVRNSVYPSAYKASKLVPIQKKDTNPLMCNSWRPVNQLVSVGKLVERALFGQIVEYFETKSYFTQTNMVVEGGTQQLQPSFKCTINGYTM